MIRAMPRLLEAKQKTNIRKDDWQLGGRAGLMNFDDQNR
jgi:hypothetical protein